MSRFDDFDFDQIFAKSAEEDSDIDFIKENAEEPQTSYREEHRTAYREEPRTAYREEPRTAYREEPRTAYRAEPRANYRVEPDGYGTDRGSGRGDTRSAGRARRDSSDYEEYRQWQESGSSSRSRGVSVPLIILIVLLVGGMVFAGWKLGSILLNYHRDRSAYSDLASTVITTPARETVTEEEAPAQVQTPGVPIHVNWTELREQNSEVIGWLYCPNTIINYPVVQRQDEEFYLNHGFDQQPNTSGTLFADFDSVEGIQLSNFIIYGHNMKDHSMFGTLTNYTDPSYWEQNPTFYYLTPNGNYRIELICAHIVESTVNNFPTRFGSTAEYQSYLNQVTSSSFWVNNSAVNTNYQLITFSTCSYTSGYVDPRFLVHGIMIPVEE